MDLFLVRLAGSRPPGLETLRAALHRQLWLAPEAGRRGVWTRAFVFNGGHVQVLTKAQDEPRYVAPGLHAKLTPDADFVTVAPRLLALAGELRLGIDTPREVWPLLGFALAGPECLELAESHPALALLLANCYEPGSPK